MSDKSVPLAGRLFAERAGPNIQLGEIASMDIAFMPVGAGWTWFHPSVDLAFSRCFESDFSPPM
jgi:hypothetical protein